MVTRLRGSNCATLPNFVEIACTAAEIMAIFQFFKTAAAAILNFTNFKIFNCGNGLNIELRHFVKLHRDGDFSLFPRRRSSAILDL